MSLNRFKELVVAVCVPSMGSWEEPFARSLTDLMMAVAQFRVGDYKGQRATLVSTKGSILPKMRYSCVMQALEMKATHLLWLDSDHSFPRRLLHKLLHTEKDIIGVNCTIKRLPSQPTARGFPTAEHPYGAPVYTDEGNTGLEKVWRLGCGIMLVNMDVFKKTGAKIFDIKYREEVQDYQGEDWSMCEAFEAAGYDIWIDHGLSQEQTHWGTLGFTHDMVGDALPFEAVQRLEEKVGKSPELAQAVSQAFTQRESGLIVPT